MLVPVLCARADRSIAAVTTGSGSEIGLLRFIEAADDIEATMVLAEDGPLAAAFAQAGAKVDILPLPERARNLRRDEMRPGWSQALAAVDVAIYVQRLRSRLLELGPDLVQVNSLKSGTYGAPAACLAGLPLVWHLHDRLAPDYLPRHVIGPMRAMMSTLPHAVVAPSWSTKDSS